VSIERGWPVWLGAGVLLVFGLPALRLGVPLTGLARSLGAGCWFTLLLGVVSQPFILVVARRVRSAEIAAYGPGLGLILGAAISFFTLRISGFETTDANNHLVPLPVGQVDAGLYLALLVTVLLLCLTLGVAAFLILPVGGQIARRLGRTYSGGFFTTYVLFTLLLLTLGLFLGPISKLFIPALGAG
jgi:hypothetical protein